LAHPAAYLTANGFPALIQSANGATPVPTSTHMAFAGGHVMGGHGAPPCSTLFVANLGPAVSEQELREIFGSFPGFCRLRMHNKGGSPVAFVEYQVRELFE
jgi:hypothetical protein